MAIYGERGYVSEIQEVAVGTDHRRAPPIAGPAFSQSTAPSLALAPLLSQRKSAHYNRRIKNKSIASFK